MESSGCNFALWTRCNTNGCFVTSCNIYSRIFLRNVATTPTDHAKSSLCTLDTWRERMGKKIGRFGSRVTGIDRRGLWNNTVAHGDRVWKFRSVIKSSFKYSTRSHVSLCPLAFLEFCGLKSFEMDDRDTTVSQWNTIGLIERAWRRGGAREILVNNNLEVGVNETENAREERSKNGARRCSVNSTVWSIPGQLPFELALTRSLLSMELLSD